jgi:hypothetical protein
MDLTLCAAVVGQKRQPPLTHPQFRGLSSRSAARDLLFTMVNPRSSQSATSPSRRGSSGHGFSRAVTPPGWGAALAAEGNRANINDCHPEESEGPASYVAKLSSNQSADIRSRGLSSGHGSPCRKSAKSAAALAAVGNFSAAKPNTYKTRDPTCAPAIPPPHTSAAKDTPGTSDLQTQSAAHPKYSHTHPAR